MARTKRVGGEDGLYKGDGQDREEEGRGRMGRRRSVEPAVPARLSGPGHRLGKVVKFKATNQIKITRPAIEPYSVTSSRKEVARRLLNPAVEYMYSLFEAAMEDPTNTELSKLALKAAEIVMDKVIGVPRVPLEGVEASGIAVVEGSDLAREAEETLKHLQSMPLEKYLEAVNRSMSLGPGEVDGSGKDL